MQIEAVGIVMGLAAALSQSASYLFARLFVLKRQGAVAELLVASHLAMGLASLLLLPFLWQRPMPAFAVLVGPVVAATLFYVLGQTGLFMLMRQVQASRVAPLLGLKILVLALIATLFLGQPLTGVKWAAVGLSVAAAWLLNTAGGRLSAAAIGWLAVSCVAYSISDLNIARLVNRLGPPSSVRASLLGVCLTYLLSGALSLGFWPWLGRRVQTVDWRYALPFSFFWFVGMGFLYGCFGSLGAVYGNILQSTRGIISVAAGAYLAHLGLERLEQRVTPRVLAQRVAAAVLMCVAIWLFRK